MRPRGEGQGGAESRRLGNGEAGSSPAMEAAAGAPGPEEPAPEITLEPKPEEQSAAAGPQEPEGPSAAKPAAGGAGEEAASGRDGVAPAEEAPDGAEQRGGEAAAGEAPEAGDEAENDEAERRLRAELLEQYRGLAEKRARLRQASARLQLQLGGRRPPAALDATGKRLYDQRLQLLWELREQREREAAARRERVEAWQRDEEERQGRARAEWAAFQSRKKALANFFLGRRLGSWGAGAAAVDRIQAREQDKEQQVQEVQVENNKLMDEIQTLESILKAQGELVECQCFMDFEHMKRESQKHSGMIDYLGAEIQELKQKASDTARTLGQFREKLQFVEPESQGRRAELADIKTVLSQKRDILTKAKQARYRLWRNSLELQQKCGLLGNEILLRDFEEKVDTAELLSQRLETLKHQHSALNLTCREIQKKNKEANSFLPAAGS
ncbi:cilia- and flagella-associated protein 184 [Porphyrio hochstetteri]